MALATTTDVSRWIGRALSSEETNQATDMLEMASAVVSDALGKSGEAWFSPLGTETKAFVKRFTAMLVARGMASPQGLTSAEETLGRHTRVERYRNGGDSPLLLTSIEAAVLRSRVYGSGSGSASVESFFDRIIDLAEGRDVDEDPA